MIEQTKTNNNQKPPTASKYPNMFLGGILLCAILWTLGALVTWHNYQDKLESEKQTLLILGDRLAQHTALSLNNIDSALLNVTDHFSKDWSHLTQNAAVSDDFLHTAFAGLKGIQSGYLLNAQGEYILHYDFEASEVTASTNLSAIELSKLPDTNKFSAMVFPDKALGVSRPIYDPKGHIKGFFLIKISTDYLEKVYQIGLRHPLQYLAIYSEKERIFATPQQFPYTYDTGLLFKTSDVQIFENPNSELVVHTKIKPYDLIVTTAIPHPVLFEHWREQAWLYAFIGLCITIALLFIARHLNKVFMTLQEEIKTRQDLTDDLQKLSRAVEQSPASVIITDRKGEIEYVNPKFCETSGFSQEEVIGKNPRVLSSGQKSKIDYAIMWKTLYSGAEWRGEFHNQRKDGTLYWESALLSAIRNKKGEITNFLAVKEDITQHKKDEAELKLAATVFDAAAEAIMVCDHERNIEMVNAAFSDITGYSRHEVIGQTPALLKSGRHSSKFYTQMISRLNDTGKWEGEIWNKRKNGEIYPQWLSIKTIHDEKGDVIRYISLFSDISHRKKNEERILFQANYDALTELPNRNLFLDRLQRALIRADRTSTQVALLFIDLDRFKNVNDSLGHAAGDLLLQEASRRLISTVRKSDTVARLGGDEFTIIIQDLTDIFLIEALVEKLLEKLSAPFILGNHKAFVSGSIGITIYPDDGNNVEELLKNADTAMYQAKENGRNLSQFFTNEMNEAALERRALETALHQALEREEFVLHYQPIVDSQTGCLASCEVLLRWHQPEHGNVFPDKFIPLAEDTGLILPIGEWVLKTACREAMIWAKTVNEPPRVAVNMSSRQFQRSNVVKLVERTLKETGLPAERLTLEITESLLVADDSSIMEQLHSVRKLGVGLSIDDFGTGYSSLSYLRKFPITTLKIDRAFINDLTTNEEAAALVSAILSMAKSLKLNVVAEGVETQEQLEYLKREGCQYIQGYYYSPPVPIEAFRTIAKSKEPLEPDQ